MIAIPAGAVHPQRARHGRPRAGDIGTRDRAQIRGASEAGPAGGRSVGGAATSGVGHEGVQCRPEVQADEAAARRGVVSGRHGVVSAAQLDNVEVLQSLLQQRHRGRLAVGIGQR